MQNDIGVYVPNILLPNKDIDMTKWSVVACDQYTSQPEYWEAVESIVENAPSTLNLIFPEVYLDKEDDTKKIKSINENMSKYNIKNLLTTHDNCFIYLNRKTTHSPSRKGIMLAIDLEKYDYNKGSTSLIRATEGTVLDRIPPRVKVRRNACLELPHVMILIDDENETVIEPISNELQNLEKVYDFELMMNGGHIEGYKISNPNLIENIITALSKLADPDVFSKKYSVDPNKGILLFAVGDGNHSLASAKAFWEELKQSLSVEEISKHSARFALVEIVNVHDAGIVFEPIHRVIFDVNKDNLFDEMVKFYSTNSSKAYISEDISSVDPQNKHIIPFITESSKGFVVIENPNLNLEVGTLQQFLDYYAKENTFMKIDYIHGDDVVKTLATQPLNIGFFLPAMDKSDLFKTVILDGALPRKTFSMGEADEKRFYLECRSIK